MKWRDKLTKKENDHLREWGITTLKQFKEMAKRQKKQRDDYSMPGLEPCWTCKQIARKLGFPV